MTDIRNEMRLFSVLCAAAIAASVVFYGCRTAERGAECRDPGCELAARAEAFLELHEQQLCKKIGSVPCADAIWATYQSIRYAIAHFAGEVPKELLATFRLSGAFAGMCDRPGA